MTDAYTIDYEVEGKYGFGQGAWEGVYTGANRRDAFDVLAEYRAAEPETEFRVRRVRVPVVFGA